MPRLYKCRPFNAQYQQYLPSQPSLGIWEEGALTNKSSTTFFPWSAFAGIASTVLFSGSCLLNHSIVWLSSLSGLSAWLAAMLWERLRWRALLTGLNHTVLLVYWSFTRRGPLPASVSWATCLHAIAQCRAWPPLFSPGPKTSFLFPLTHKTYITDTEKVGNVLYIWEAGDHVSFSLNKEWNNLILCQLVHMNSIKMSTVSMCPDHNYFPF